MKPLTHEDICTCQACDMKRIDEETQFVFPAFALIGVIIAGGVLLFLKWWFS